MMNFDQDPGLRPAVRSACRAALRELLGAGSGAASGSAELSRHVDDCPMCRERVAAAASLAKALGVRPRPPAELDSEQLLEGVFARVLAEAEASPLCEHLASRPTPIADAEDGWPTSVGDGLAQHLERPPQAPAEGVWQQVRATVVTELRSAALAKSRRHWLLGLAGVAAAVTVALVLLSEGTQMASKIVFVDIDSVPDIGFAAIRHGGSR